MNVDPRETALLVMDYQQGVVGMLEEPDGLLGRAARAIELARARGAHVGYVRVAFTPDDVAAMPPWSAMGARVASAADAFGVDSPATAIHDRVAPEPGDVIVRKTRVGAFSTTDLDEQLRARGVTTLVLAGISTSGVVLSTVRDAADRDYRLVVLSDACGDRDEDVHACLIERIFPRQAQVVTVAELEDLLTSGKTTQPAAHQAHDGCHPRRSESTMGLSWQQGPLGRNPNGRFLVPGMPERVLYAEPLRRRLRAELGGRTVVCSDDAVLLFEPGRYPVAYFPLADFAEGALRPTDHRTEHPDLGETAWFEVAGGGRGAARAAWQHVALPEHAAILAGRVALAWRAIDAFYEEDDRILGHAADPYHRIDVRHSSRHLVVRAGERVVADTAHPLVLYESGFAPRWYVPRADVVADALQLAGHRTFCPYKGIASYYDVGGIGRGAWSYRDPFDEMAPIGDLVSFEPDRVEVTLDGERLELEPGQTVVAHGIDRDLTVGVR